MSDNLQKNHETHETHETDENNTSLNSQWTKETFGYLEIFDFEIFDFVNSWPFIQWPGLTFSPT